MNLSSLRRAGLAAARILMYAAWFGVALWAAGVVFYNIWGGVALVWLYAAGMACAFAFRKRYPAAWWFSWGILLLLLV